MSRDKTNKDRNHNQWDNVEFRLPNRNHKRNNSQAKHGKPTRRNLIGSANKQIKQEPTLTTSSNVLDGTTQLQPIALDMSLNQNVAGHGIVLRSNVKRFLFPKLKFISPNTTDLEFNSTGGICGLLLRTGNVDPKNARWYWHTFRSMVPQTLNATRNNRIKSIQARFVGT